ncbi:MAG: hypothetical protein JXA67_04235 [Micromonosporaceae bacterium]|nr:hypothetical protein [Micromonosporaceae bacterium]
MRIRIAVAATAAVVVLIAGACYAIWHAISNSFSLSLPGSPSCVVGAGVAVTPASGDQPQAAGGTGGGGEASASEEVTLTPHRMANAATIAAVGLRRSVPERAIVIALATALQESKLDNLSGGDRDSVGLFQQRPSQGWGTVEQIADPRYAAGAFYTALLKVRGWQTMRVTEAAQAVQRSAHPELYEKWTTTAQTLTSALAGSTGRAVACTLSQLPSPSGPAQAATASLAASLRLDWGKTVATAETSGPPGVSVTAGNARKGWQYAHWLVSHAQDTGVARVRYEDQEWTARKGSWRQTGSTARVGRGKVVADVVTGSTASN